MQILDRSAKDSRQRKRRDEATEFIAVRGDLMGFVIGRKGSSIKEIEMKSGARLNQPDGDQNGFLVSGNKEQRARARELVQRKVVSANLVPRVFMPHCSSLTKRATLDNFITDAILIGNKNDENGVSPIFLDI